MTPSESLRYAADLLDDAHASDDTSDAADAERLANLFQVANICQRITGELLVIVNLACVEHGISTVRTSTEDDADVVRHVVRTRPDA